MHARRQYARKLIIAVTVVATVLVGCRSDAPSDEQPTDAAPMASSTPTAPAGAAPSPSPEASVEPSPSPSPSPEPPRPPSSFTSEDAASLAQPQPPQPVPASGGANRLFGLEIQPLDGDRVVISTPRTSDQNLPFSSWSCDGSGPDRRDDPSHWVTDGTAGFACGETAVLVDLATSDVIATPLTAEGIRWDTGAGLLAIGQALDVPASGLQEATTRRFVTVHDVATGWQTLAISEAGANVRLGGVTSSGTVVVSVEPDPNAFPRIEAYDAAGTLVWQRDSTGGRFQVAGDVIAVNGALLDADTGETLVDGMPDRANWGFNDCSTVTTTEPFRPVIVQDVIVLPSTRGELAAYDVDGVELWELDGILVEFQAAGEQLWGLNRSDQWVRIDPRTGTELAIETDHWRVPMFHAGEGWSGTYFDVRDRIDFATNDDSVAGIVLRRDAVEPCDRTRSWWDL